MVGAGAGAVEGTGARAGGAGGGGRHPLRLGGGPQAGDGGVGPGRGGHTCHGGRVPRRGSRAPPSTACLSPAPSTAPPSRLWTTLLFLASPPTGTRRVCPPCRASPGHPLAFPATPGVPSCLTSVPRAGLRLRSLAVLRAGIQPAEPRFPGKPVPRTPVGRLASRARWKAASRACPRPRGPDPAPRRPEVVAPLPGPEPRLGPAPLPQVRRRVRALVGAMWWLRRCS